MIIEIPEKLNGYSFYTQILPQIHRQFELENYMIDFSLQNTEVANPEGFVNLLAAALMIKNKNEDTYISKLYMPESEKLISFMEHIDFFTPARSIPTCEVFNINYQPSYKAYNRGGMSRIYGIYVHSDDYSILNKHYANIDDIIKKIRKELSNEYDRDIDYFYQNLRDSLIQLVRNTIEHNKNYKESGALGYYMAQKTPYNTIEFVISDVGLGYRNRITEMIKENKDSNIQKYIEKKDDIQDNKFLYRDNEKNPNRLAIEVAINYRDDSMVPGLFQIRKFVLEQEDSNYTQKSGNIISLKPSLFIHSDNYSIQFEKDNPYFKFYNNDFSGCHIKITIPIPIKQEEAL